MNAVKKNAAHEGGKSLVIRTRIFPEFGYLSTGYAAALIAARLNLSDPAEREFFERAGIGGAS